jgi:RNA recognition motif-containing protein
MGDEQINTVYVANLAWKTREDALARFFSNVVEVMAVRVIQDPRTGLSKGYGFIEVGGEDGAMQRACSLHGCELDGRKLIVSPARNNRKKNTGKT